MITVVNRKFTSKFLKFLKIVSFWLEPTTSNIKKINALGNATSYNISITACKSNVNLMNKKLEKKTQTAKNSYKLPPNDLFYLKKKWCVAPEICRFLYFCIFYIRNFKNLWRHHRYCRQQCCPLWKVYFWLPDNFFYLVLRDFFSLFVSQ